MDVIWYQYDIYVCHVTLSHDSHMTNSYVLRIVYLPNTDIRDANAHDLVYMEVIFKIPYVPHVAKLSDTHIAFSYSAHIDFTYGCHLRPIWHICVPHDLAIWQSYWKLVRATYCLLTWHRYDRCKCIRLLLYGSYIENSYAPQVAKVPDTHIASS